jgi:hypothetical protein
MAIDWTRKLQRLLETVGFSLGIATVIYGIFPEAQYGPNAVLSVSIGLGICLIIDFGRHLFPSSQETGWPHGLPGALLVLAGIVGGFTGGSLVTNLIGRSTGWFDGPSFGNSREMRVAMIITAVAGIVSSYYFYSRGRKQFLETKIAETSKLANEARLKLLETQLEPHMLFNTLANLRVLIGVDPARAQQMLDHMIAYLRATLGASRAANHPLQLEFERLRDYLELMAIRMGPRLQYTLELPPDLERAQVPALLLQPLVENAIKHGLEPKVGGGRIDVTARREGTEVVLDVSDTGAGLAAPGQPGSGFGLAQVRERLSTVYGTRARLDVVAAPGGGCRVTVHYPAAP